MATPVYTEPATHLVDLQAIPALNVLGPTVQFLTSPEGDDREPCVMLGTVPPGVIVPLHSHPDPETFIMRSGRLDGLTPAADGFHWTPLGPGEIFHVPGNVKHAWRNPLPERAVTIIVSTVKMGRFFDQLGTPVEPDANTAWPPTEHAIQRFLETAERFGYWNASPQENAAVGLQLG